MSDKGMFTELMEASQGSPRGVRPTRPPDHQSPAPPRASKPKPGKEALPEELPDLSEAGYTSHSYRFTEEELRWLRRFCLQTSAEMDRPVTHNTLIRLLFRLADAEWKSNPRSNRLRELISALKT